MTVLLDGVAMPGSGNRVLQANAPVAVVHEAAGDSRNCRRQGRKSGQVAGQALRHQHSHPADEQCGGRDAHRHPMWVAPPP